MLSLSTGMAGACLEAAGLVLPMSGVTVEAPMGLYPLNRLGSGYVMVRLAGCRHLHRNARQGGSEAMDSLTEFVGTQCRPEQL